MGQQVDRCQDTLRSAMLGGGADKQWRSHTMLVDPQQSDRSLVRSLRIANVIIDVVRFESGW
jgi:hypothetical protein